MYNFPLKKEFYEMIISKKKTIEFRPYNDYWKARIPKINKDERIKFTCGYSKQRVFAKVKRINVLYYWDLPKYARKFLKSMFYEKGISHYFAIHFEIIDEPVKKLPCYNNVDTIANISKQMGWDRRK